MNLSPQVDNQRPEARYCTVLCSAPSPRPCLAVNLTKYSPPGKTATIRYSSIMNLTKYSPPGKTATIRYSSIMNLTKYSPPDKTATIRYSSIMKSPFGLVVY